MKPRSMDVACRPCDVRPLGRPPDRDASQGESWTCLVVAAGDDDWRGDASDGHRRLCRGGTEGGFTLMEVMVALAVVAIALLAVYRMHSQTLFMDVRGRFDTLATMLAREKIADIDASDLKDLIGDSGDFGNDYPGYTWQIQTEDVVSDLLKDDGPILKRITISIGQGDNQFTLTTYRHLYE